MALTRLLITDFRNISSADLTLTTGFNGLIGSNGSGKSSLLEAIYTLGHGRGFHQHPVQQVIRHTTQQFVLHGQIEQSQQQDKIGLCKTRQGATQVRINGGNNHKIAELAQNLPIQLITPESIHLLNGGPKYRRAFLDWGCFHHESAFFQAWHQTRRLLQQRNAALKNARHYQALQSWDQQLVPLAEQITAWRATYSAALTEKITTICAQLLPEYRFSFHFQRGWDAQYDYATLLQQYFKRDYSATYTLLGPHRADLHIRADGIPVESHLSRGQLKLLVYALRLSQGEYFTQMMGKDCLYLLDDFAAELDSTRRQLLAEHFKKMGTQIIASAIDQQQLSDFKSEKEKLFLVEHGTIIAKSFE